MSAFWEAVDGLHSAVYWSRCESVTTINLTELGVLRVELERPKRWSAYRGEYPLLRNGNPACVRFAWGGEAHCRSSSLWRLSELRDDLRWPSLVPWHRPVVVIFASGHCLTWEGGSVAGLIGRHSQWLTRAINRHLLSARSRLEVAALSLTVPEMQKGDPGSVRSS